MKTQNSNTEKLQMASQLINEVVNNQDNVSLNLLEELKKTILDRITEIDYREIKEKLEYNADCDIESNGCNEFSVNVNLSERDIHVEFCSVMTDIVEMEFQNIVDFKNYTKDTKIDFKTALGMVGSNLEISDLYARFMKNYSKVHQTPFEELLKDKSDLNYYEILTMSFTWSETIEGDKYWRKIKEEMEKLGL